MNIAGNPIGAIAPHSFSWLHKLSSLDLNQLHLRDLFPLTFTGLDKCLSLNLSNNRLHELHLGVFKGLRNLLVLDISQNRLVTISADISRTLIQIKVIHLDLKQFCCLFVQVIGCNATKINGDVSCEHLVSNTAARYVGWSTATFSLILKPWSICFWGKRGDFTVYAATVCGLSSADMLMVMSLFLVLFMDFQSRGVFVAQYSATWRESVQCLFASYLSIISYQLSMTFLAIIYFFRLYAIRFPFKAKDYKPYNQLTLAAVISLILSLGLGSWLFYSHQTESSFHIKAISSLCNFAPEINDHSTLNPGYIILYLVNVSLYSVITTCAWFMLYSTKMQLRNMRSGILPSSHKRVRDSQWLIFKIILNWVCTTLSFLGLPLSSMGILDRISDLKLWLAFLIIPLYSVVNPLLYTFCTPQFLSSIKSLC